MRLPVTAAILSCTLLVLPARAELKFPYRAAITTDDTYIRSGPGQSYYPTDKLKAGQEVEVYRHDPGGWYAIRPPQGSFSLISGRYLEIKGDSLAVVTDEQVAARVGSRFSDIRDVIQVRLHRGEMVEILQEKPPAGNRGPSWYKISPPSGEFRWVFGKFVDPNFNVSGVRQTAAPEAVPAAAAALPAVPVANVATVPTPLAASAAPGPATLAPLAVPTTPTTPASPAPAAADVPVASPAPVAIAPLEQPAFAPVTVRNLTADEFQKQVNEIDVELAIMVAEEPTVWKFDQLALRAQSLLAQADTAVERGRARMLVSRITRFQDLKQRSDSVAALRQETEQTNRQLVSLRVPGAGGNPAGGSSYDGTGRLTRVVSPNPGAPRYALVDKSGAVQCYVSPAPGVDLRHYVGREVGVTGTRGYMPEQRAQHLMAKHITPLEATAIR